MHIASVYRAAAGARIVSVLPPPLSAGTALPANTVAACAHSRVLPAAAPTPAVAAAAAPGTTCISCTAVQVLLPAPAAGAPAPAFAAALHASVRSALSCRTAATGWISTVVCWTPAQLLAAWGAGARARAGAVPAAAVALVAASAAAAVIAVAAAAAVRAAAGIWGVAAAALVVLFGPLFVLLLVFVVLFVLLALLAFLFVFAFLVALVLLLALRCLGVQGGLLQLNLPRGPVGCVGMQNEERAGMQHKDETRQ